MKILFYNNTKTAKFWTYGDRKPQMEIDDITELTEYHGILYLVVRDDRNSAADVYIGRIDNTIRDQELWRYSENPISGYYLKEISESEQAADRSIVEDQLMNRIRTIHIHDLGHISQKALV
jgi:hypothetical protein